MLGGKEGAKMKNDFPSPQDITDPSLSN